MQRDFLRTAHRQIGDPFDRFARRRNVARMLNFDEPQLDFFDGQIVACLCVKLVQHFRGHFDFVALTFDGKTFAATRDRYIECRFDLAQVRIQRTTERIEAMVVHGRKREFE
jgi:hypothetical protein